MERKEYLNKIKQEQKDRALKIRELKMQRKPSHRPSGLSQLDIHDSLADARWDFRHQHIVYCLLRGKSREVIEQPHESNLPSESQISNLLEDYETVVCVSQDGS